MFAFVVYFIFFFLNNIFIELWFKQANGGFVAEEEVRDGGSRSIKTAQGAALGPSPCAGGAEELSQGRFLPVGISLHRGEDPV